MIGLITLILQLFKIFIGYINALFILIVEAAFFAAPIYYVYLFTRHKVGLPELGYLDIAMILLAIKCVKFSMFDMGKINSSEPQTSLFSHRDEERNSHS